MPDNLEEIDPVLVAKLAELFDEYGPTGTVNVATRMLAKLRAAEIGQPTAPVPPPRNAVTTFRLPPTDV